MAVKTINGIREGHSSVEAEIVDAMGGGLCKVHGKYYGHGKYGLRDCPFCDIDEHFKSSIIGSEERK